MVGDGVTAKIAGLGLTKELGHEATGCGQRAVDRLPSLLDSSDLERQLCLGKALNDVVVDVERVPFPFPILSAIGNRVIRLALPLSLPPDHAHQT